MKDKLSFVSSETENKTDGRLLITDNGELSGLAYITGGKINSITGEDSRFRPSLMSELSERLRKRDWNITERKYIFSEESDRNEELFLKISQTSEAVDYIDIKKDVSESGTVLGVQVSYSSLSLPEDIVKTFEKEYSEILSNMDKNEIYLYNTSKNIVDILEGSVIIDVIQYNSDIYTGTVNLGQFIRKAAYPGISGKVDLGIQYSTKNGSIRNYSTTFEGFKYTKNGKGTELKLSNIIDEVEEDVVIEYIDGTIKVVPVSQDIYECIISNCTLTYGNIG